MNRITACGVLIAVALLVSACADSGGDDAAAEATTPATDRAGGPANMATPASAVEAGQGTVTVSEGIFTFDITSCIAVQAQVQYLIDGITAEGHTAGLTATGDMGSASFTMVDPAGNPIRKWGSQQASAEIDGSRVTVSGNALVVSMDSDETVVDEITVIANIEDCS